MDLILFVLTSMNLGNGNLELGPVGRLDSQQGLAVKAVANILVGDVGQLVVGNVVKDVFYTLLSPLKIIKSDVNELSKYILLMKN